MYTLELFRKHFGYIGLITYNHYIFKMEDKEDIWGFEIYKQLEKGNTKKLSLVVRATDLVSYEEAERDCIEHISKELNSELNLLINNTDEYKLKVIKEHNDLQIDIIKLKTFLATHKFKTELDLVEKESLIKELETMEVYRGILSERINNFTK